MVAREQLLALRNAPDPFATPPAALAELRLEAARELFRERRETVPLLASLAKENGVKEISSISDLVPVLLSHTSYKSYPLTFVKNAQWKRMLQWLALVSTQSPVGVDVEGVKDVDDFIARLWQAGHMVATTSATSGKFSLLPRNAHDHGFTRDFIRKVPGWPGGIAADNSRHFFMFGPRGGPYVAGFMATLIADLYGRADSRHYLSEEPLKVANISALAEYRLRMAAGTATPGETAEMEKRAAAQAETSGKRLDEMLDSVLALRGEPMYIVGQAAQLWNLMIRARERGIHRGGFHPQTVVSTSSLIKGGSYPADYMQQILDFLGPVRVTQAYGMSEMSWFPPRCRAGRYHEVPWIIPMLLDRNGETLLAPVSGVAEGRYGFLDLSFEARWGGLISGDKVQIDHAPVCPCGHPGPTFLPTITRYSDVGDDRIGCAGTVDAYIRGAMEP